MRRFCLLTAAVGLVLVMVSLLIGTFLHAVRAAYPPLIVVLCTVVIALVASRNRKANR